MNSSTREMARFLGKKWGKGCLWNETKGADDKRVGNEQKFKYGKEVRGGRRMKKFVQNL
jgi:hypothetical protein